MKIVLSSIQKQKAWLILKDALARNYNQDSEMEKTYKIAQTTILEPKNSTKMRNLQHIAIHDKTA